MWKLNILENNVFKDKWVKEDITREIRKYFKMNENENATYQNFWDAVKAVLRENYGCIPKLRKKKDLQ